jgi:ribosome-associated protein
VRHEISPEQQDDAIWSRVLGAVEAALDKKALDPVVLDLRKASQLADYFVLVSGRSDTQVRAIADSVEERGRRDGVRPRSVEGTAHGQWILLDYGDFVVHVFYEPVRKFYDIERLWSRAPRCELPPSLTQPPAGERPASLPSR